jgi:hypothetical protein
VSRASQPRVLRVILWNVLASLLVAFQVVGHAQTVSEYQAKALYLYNFAKFVDWPVEAFEDSAAPLKLCVLRENPFGSDLEQIVEGKVIAGHAVRIVTVQNGDQVRGCHILFVSRSQSKQSNQILGVLGPVSVLTVGESKGFVQQGGMINFVVEDDRVQFEVNQKAAEQVRLKISFRLLSLAKLVIK